MKIKDIKNLIHYQPKVNYDELGIEASKEKWFNQNWVGFLIALIMLLFNIYQHLDNRSLKSDYNSLKVQYKNHKDSIVQLNKKLEAYKMLKRKETLQTKN